MSENLVSENLELLTRWQQVSHRIEQACQAAALTTQNEQVVKSHGAVMLLAVSKTKPADMVATLYHYGQRHFGENYLQEAISKMKEVHQLLTDANNVPNGTEEGTDANAHNGIQWHYIGHIQRNKTKDIAAHFDWVQTIDRDIIAQRLNDQRPADAPPLNVLIQVNIDLEDSKSGCLPQEVSGLVAYTLTLPKLCLRGLMVIPAPLANAVGLLQTSTEFSAGDNHDSDAINFPQELNAFARTQALFHAIAHQFADHPAMRHWDTLSMGMSDDMELAIAHGSTMVRVGTALFGKR